eukprot:437841_1
MGNEFAQSNLFGGDDQPRTIRVNTMINFKKVSTIHQKYKDTVFGFIVETEQNNGYVIAERIKHLILLFYYNNIDSSILTDSEQIKLLSLFETNGKSLDQEWNLLYRSSRDGIGLIPFKEKCDNHSNIVCLVESECNNVFGGFTSIGWDDTGTNHIWGYNYDDKAFLFSIRSSKKYKPYLVTPRYPFQAIRTQMRTYCIFGSSELWLYENWVDTNNSRAFNAFPVNDYYLLGGKFKAKVINVEVFELK